MQFKPVNPKTFTLKSSACFFNRLDYLYLLVLWTIFPDINIIRHIHLYMITGVIVCFCGILTGYNNDDKQDNYQHQYCHPGSITDTYSRNLRPIYPVPPLGIAHVMS